MVSMSSVNSKTELNGHNCNKVLSSSGVVAFTFGWHHVYEFHVINYHGVPRNSNRCRRQGWKKFSSPGEVYTIVLPLDPGSQDYMQTSRSL